MKKIFVLALLVSVIFTNFVLPCEKANAAKIRYWICGVCNMKDKTINGYVPARECYTIFGRFSHFHDWQEVDYQTWITW